MSLRNGIGALLRSRTGSVAVWFSLAIIPITGLVGFGIDLNFAVNRRSELQDIADGAALAGARQLQVSGSTSSATTAATASVDSHSVRSEIDAPTIATDSSNGQVRVTLSGAAPSFFLSTLGLSPMRVSATALAGANPGGPPVCVHALDSSMARAISASGGSALNANGCVAWVNSSSSSSVDLSGGSYLKADEFCMVGGLARSRNAQTTSPTTCPARADPFTGRNPASPSGCTYNNFLKAGGTWTVSPGVYCGGLRTSGGARLNLQPGVYYIRDGLLSQSGGGGMTGTGVTFVIEGNSSVNLSGGGDYHLTAPTTGDTAGFVFFQRPDANPGVVANMSGGGDLYYEGVVYFPTQPITVSGGGSTTTPSPFTAYIARNFTYSGGSEFKIDWDPSRVTVPIDPGLRTGSGSVHLLR